MVHDFTKLEVYGTVYLQWRVRGVTSFCFFAVILL